MKRILVGGTGSGCGKTTITCAILKALQMRGLRVSSFKCGPDYIDPMFHREIIGASSANLDGFFCDPAALKGLLRQQSAGTDIAVIEGVMGYYDGMKAGGSAYDIARITNTPAVIVINARGMHESLEAVMTGYLSFRQDSRICGFLFNQLPLSLEKSAEEMCRRLDTRYFGCMPRHEISLESRNLGLVAAAEVPDLKDKIQRLGELAQAHMDLERLVKLADCGEEERQSPFETGKKTGICVVRQAAAGRTGPDPAHQEISSDCGPLIAVSKDEAFCFCYPENIRLLEDLGCRIAYFSPLSDAEIPADADGLYLCGGYPELHAKTLSENRSMRESVRRAVEGGMPTIAECGGFLYLHRELLMKKPGTETAGATTEDPPGEEEKTAWPLAGVIDAAAFARGTLQRFGYVTLTAREDSLICEKGGTIRAHEFHYWDSECPGDLFLAQKQDGRSWTCGIGSATLYAGFPHLYFYAKPQMAERFAAACRSYAEGKKRRIKRCPDEKAAARCKRGQSR